MHFKPVLEANLPKEDKTVNPSYCFPEQSLDVIYLGYVNRILFRWLTFFFQMQAYSISFA